VAGGFGVPTTGIEGIVTVRMPDDGVCVGWVGSSSVIVWHPTSTTTAAAIP
jgi:hypothetical protein